MQGAQGGGGGAGFSQGGSAGEAGGLIVPGQPGQKGDYVETSWTRASGLLLITVGEGGHGGHGVAGLHGGKGADGWMRVEVRRITLLALLRYRFASLRDHLLRWLARIRARLSLTNVAAIATVLTLVVASPTLLVTCNQ